ncbi:hypothetical protein HYS47_04950 [Candidatus Woesearchaeota archaeon]|nr:hypothetical protein [Candidatus Woesearchaeota archaeon]
MVTLIAVFDREELERQGKTIDDTAYLGPNSAIGLSAVLFHAPFNQAEKEELERDPDFRRYSKDPERYYITTVSGN